MRQLPAAAWRIMWGPAALCGPAHLPRVGLAQPVHQHGGHSATSARGPSASSAALTLLPLPLLLLRAPGADITGRPLLLLPPGRLRPGHLGLHIGAVAGSCWASGCRASLQRSSCYLTAAILVVRLQGCGRLGCNHNPHRPWLRCGCPLQLHSAASRSKGGPWPSPRRCTRARWPACASQSLAAAWLLSRALLVLEPHQKELVAAHASAKHLQIGGFLILMSPACPQHPN
jgi:hypothetical protein